MENKDVRKRAMQKSLDTILQEAGNCYLYEKMGYHRTGHQAIIQENMTIVDYEKD